MDSDAWVAGLNVSHDAGGAIFSDGNVVADHLGNVDPFPETSNGGEDAADNSLKIFSALAKFL